MSRWNAVLVAAIALGLSGCGGGGSAVVRPEASSEPIVHPEVPAEPMARPAPMVGFPRPVTERHYAVEGLEPRTALDAQHMPVYHDGEHLMVGVDQGSGIAALPAAAKRGETVIRHGRLRDGVGVGELAGHPGTPGRSIRWESPPLVTVGGRVTPGDYERVIRAVQLINAALPEPAKLRVSPSYTLAPPDRRTIKAGLQGDGIIHVDFTGATNGTTAGELVHSGFDQEFRELKSAEIWIFHGYERAGDRPATIVLAHEILHALGMFGHAPTDIASIMHGSQLDFETAQYGVPQPLSLLYPADREALRARGTLDDTSPESLGEWIEPDSVHLAAVAPHAAFGVALRNGYGEPWVYGPRPETALADNPRLSGSVTWTGVLVGITPGAEAVSGDAEIGIDFATMAGRVDFTALESWPADAAPGAAGTGAQWGDGDLEYAIAVRGNTFRETGGDDGRLTGIFTGAGHEGAAGTLDRLDLTAAFGAGRE